MKVEILFLNLYLLKSFITLKFFVSFEFKKFFVQQPDSDAAN